MKFKFHLLILLLGILFFNCLSAQIPGIKWQKTIGGSGRENDAVFGAKLLATTDGDVLCMGTTSSTDGDVTHLIGFYDIILSRFSKDGIKKWSQNYGHPFSIANMGAISETKDGGFIVVCSFTGYNDNIFDPYTHSISILKITSSGVLEWEASYQVYLEYGGGVGIFQTSDNGYLLCLSNSHILVMKLDSQGAMVSEKTYGGSSTNSTETPMSMARTIDGQFVIVGNSYSSDGDFSGYPYQEKAFILKVDINGDKQWLKAYTDGEGSFNAIIQDSLGNYYCGGVGKYTNSIYSDAMIGKLDVSGNPIWEKTFIGSGDEYVSSLTLTRDTGLAFCGYTESSDGDFSLNVYKGRYWVGKVDRNSGSTSFQTFFGGPSSYCHAEDIVQLADEGIAVFGISDTLNPYLTNYKGGLADFWLIKLGAVNTIRGNIFIDANGNGIKDAGERPFDLAKVKILNNSSNDSVLLSSFDGNFIINTDTGHFTSTLILEDPYYSSVNNVKTSVFTNYYNTDSISFPVVPIPGKTDVRINAIPMTPVRLGNLTHCKLVFRNVGTKALNGVSIKVIADGRLSLFSSQPVETTTADGIYNWNIPLINPFDTGTIDLYFKIPTSPSLNLGDTLILTAVILPPENDLTPADDTAILKQTIIGSYDPNDKTEGNAGIITPAQVSNGAYLNYTIRFQNTGTDTAFKIIIKDTLENRLDWSTFQMTSASHPYQLTVNDNNKLTWLFDNIHLPDSNKNEPLSHGYISYRIQPKKSVIEGDTILNKAGIYFDFNPSVSTKVQKTVVFDLAPLPLSLTSLKAAPNGSDVDVYWTTSSVYDVDKYEIQRSANGTDFITIGTVMRAGDSYTFKDTSPLPGDNFYRLIMVGIDGSQEYSDTVVVKLGNNASFISSIYPNPALDEVTLKIKGTVEGAMLVQILNQLGENVFIQNIFKPNSDDLTITLNLGKLAKGEYVLRLIANNKVYLHNLLLQ